MFSLECVDWYRWDPLCEQNKKFFDKFHNWKSNQDELFEKYIVDSEEGVWEYWVVWDKEQLLYDWISPLLAKIYQNADDKVYITKWTSKLFEQCAVSWSIKELRDVCKLFLVDYVWSDIKITKLNYSQIYKSIYNNRLEQVSSEFWDFVHNYNPLDVVSAAIRKEYVFWDYMLWVQRLDENEGWIFVLKAWDTHRQHFAKLKGGFIKSCYKKNKKLLCDVVDIKYYNSGILYGYELQSNWSWNLVLCSSADVNVADNYEKKHLDKSFCKDKNHFIFTNFWH